MTITLQRAVHIHGGVQRYWAPSAARLGSIMDYPFTGNFSIRFSVLLRTLRQPYFALLSTIESLNMRPKRF